MSFALIDAGNYSAKGIYYEVDRCKDQSKCYWKMQQMYELIQVAVASFLTTEHSLNCSCQDINSCLIEMCGRTPQNIHPGSS